ncbi:nuclear protein 96-domain-containing protein [Dissophora ornata]|nr:nuclear protein 96-domain-containing protein [Dissophora ornata]
MFNSGFGSGGFGGQQQQNTGFGSGQNAFGSTSSFGAPATGFGAAGNTGFGGTAQNTGFGAAPATNAFGAAPATAGFGGGGFGGSTSGFGVQAQAQPQTGFGGSSFGATNTSNTAGGFGGFGSNTASTGGFGSGAGFGAKPATAGFGAQPATGFGTATNTGFGGATNTFGGGGMLGAGMNASAGTGTVNPAFTPFIEKEPATGQNSHYQSITAMPAYRGYSFEELRLQDYQQGRKFPAQGAGFGGATSGFGQQPAATGFGAAATTGFGATSNTSTLGGFGSGSAGFGGAATSGFGAPTGFGATAPASTGFGAQGTTSAPGFGATSSAFGAQPTAGFGATAGTTGFGATGGFGAATAAKPTPGFGGFGATATSQPASGFGAAAGGFGAAASAPGLFGNTGAGTSAFGAPATATSTGFGGFGGAQTSAAPASTGLGFGLGTGAGAFGAAAKPAGTSLFGNPATSTAAAPSFGGFGTTPASGAGGLFGGASTGSSLFPAASTASTGLFGGPTTTAPAFGASTTSTGLFGGSKPAGTGLFGQQPTTGFGATPAFGAAGATQTSSLFGGTGTSTMFGNSILGGSTFGASTNTAVAQPTLVASVSENIYGDNPLFQRDNTASASKSQPAVLSRSEPAKKLPAFIPPLRFSPRHSQIRFRPTSTATFSSSVSGGDLASGRKSLLLLDGINDDSFSYDDYAPRRSVKKLQLKPRGSDSDHSSFPARDSYRSGITFNPSLEYTAAESVHKAPYGQDRAVAANDRFGESQIQAGASRHESSSSAPTAARNKTEGEYWMSPALEDLRKLSQSELQHVSGFQVGLPGFGSVAFQEPVDLTTVPSLSAICGNIVIFDHKICKVYPDESNKPPRGQGLNVPAIISLEGCWPKDRATGETVKFDKSSPQYTQHLKRLKRQPETTFMDFNAENGTWTFRVEHFSEYGLTDEDEAEVAHTDSGRRVITTAVRARQGYDQNGAESSSMESDDQVKYYPELSQSNHAARYSKNTDPQRLNLMRTSLFADSYPKQDRVPKRSSVWSTSSENTEQAELVGEHAGAFKAETRPSFQEDYDVKESLLLRPPRKFTRSSYEQSLLTRKGNLLADAGLMMGRSCRVGWGPNGLLAVCGTIHGFEDIKESTGKHESISHQSLQLTSSPTVVQLLKIRTVAAPEEIETQRHIVSLQALLRNTTITLDQNDQPRANIEPGTTFTTLISHLKDLYHELSTEEVNAWILGQSLFDPQPTPENISQMPAAAQESYESIGRRVRCGNWLSFVTKPLLEADLRRIEVEGGAMAQEESIFTLLLSNKRQKASVAAVRSKDLRLATLISQSGRGSRPLSGVEDQMALYKLAGAEGRIPASYLKVYALLCGALKANIAPKGEPSRSVTDGLDWRRTFGLYLWYSNDPGANLKEALDGYTLAMSEDKAVARPQPWYLRKDQMQDPEHFDFLFQLITLLTFPSKSLEDVLHPLGMTPSCLDYRQSWLFYMVLSQSLRISRFRKEATHAKICQDFIFQLENLGLWEWAVFVALHLETAISREMVVRQILERHVDLPGRSSNTSGHATVAELKKWAGEYEKKTFLCKTLRVPETWFWIARATRAKYLGELNWEVFSLLKGGEHEKGHALILSSLAPTFVLQGDLTTFSYLLKMIDHSKVSGWETGGSIYQKYLECCSDFEGKMGQLKLKSKVSYANDLVPAEVIQALQVEVQTLLKRLPLLLSTRGQTEVSPSLEVCVTEMASKCTAQLCDLKDLSIQESASLTDLPLTEDQRMSTVQKISSDYFDEILKLAETSAY